MNATAATVNEISKRYVNATENTVARNAPKKKRASKGNRTMKTKSIIAAAIIAATLAGGAAHADTSVPAQDGAKWYVNGAEVHHDGKFWYDIDGNVLYTDVPTVTDNTGSTTTPPTTESTSTNAGSTTTESTTESTTDNTGTTTTESTTESTTNNTGTTTTPPTTESTTTDDRIDDHQCRNDDHGINKENGEHQCRKHRNKRNNDAKHNDSRTYST